MKKLWGILICGLVSAACCLGTLFAGGNNTAVTKAAAAEDYIASGFSLVYSDNKKITTQDKRVVKNHLNENGFMVFEEEYLGAGAYSGMKGTFELNMGAHQLVDSGWVKVVYGKDVTQAAERLNDPNYRVPDGEISPLGNMAASDSTRPYFEVYYGNAGVYCFQITGTSPTAPVLATIVIVAKNEKPNITAVFINNSFEDNSNYTLFVSDITDEWTATLEYLRRSGYPASNISIKETGTNAVTGLPEFLTYKHESGFNEVNGIYYDRFIISKVRGAAVSQGTWNEITFSVWYDDYNDVTNAGVFVPAGVEKVSMDIVATINLVVPSSGYEFPFVGILICVAVIGVLGGALLGCNWLVKYVHEQNSEKVKRAKAERAETDNQNLKLLRKHLMKEGISDGAPSSNPFEAKESKPDTFKSVNKKKR